MDEPMQAPVSRAAFQQWEEAEQGLMRRRTA